MKINLFINNYQVGEEITTLAQFRAATEWLLLRQMMKKYRNNQFRVAKILDINRATLHKKLVDYGIFEK